MSRFVGIILIVVLGFTLTFCAIYFGTAPPAAVTTGFPDTIQKVLPSVVHIMCNQWQGSGVAITEDIIVTARHVIDGEHYSITLNSGETVYGIQAITHKDYDVGFIKIKNAYWLNGKPKLKPAQFGSIEDCVLGQSIFVIGSAAGKINFNSISLGIVSGLNRGIIRKDRGWAILFQTDAEGQGGNSGGPIFTMDGIVRGIWVGSIPPAVHYSIPVDVFIKDIEGIKLMFAFQKYKVEKPKVYNRWNGYGQGYK